MSALLAEVRVEEGVVRLEPRVARIESDIASLKDRVESLDEKVERLDEKVERLDEKVDNLDRRMVVMETEFGILRGNQADFAIDLRDLRNSLDSKFMWILTAMIAFGMALLAAMAEGFHWFK